MAKRFTDTEKYKKKFYRSLTGPYKLFWDYLYHDCSSAGIWIVDFEIAQLFIGMDMPINKTDALKYFNSDKQRIFEFQGGGSWFIPKFIKFQYGPELSVKNRAHSGVISKLNEYDLWHLLKEPKPPISPLQGAKDKDEDEVLFEDKDEDENKDEVPEKLSEAEMIDLMMGQFLEINPEYPTSDKDKTALKVIADFLGGPQGKSNRDLIITLWQELIDKLPKFWKDKSLQTLSNNIQNIIIQIKAKKNHGKLNFNKEAAQQYINKS